MKTIKHDDRTETLNDKGELHSFNGEPAIEYNNGTKSWLKEGKYHRLDGPALECSNGSKWWYKEGEIHRVCGPAIECTYAKWWYKEGNMHRLDGPAIVYGDGDKFWYYEGKEIECESTEEFLKIINLKAFW